MRRAASWPEGRGHVSERGRECGGTAHSEGRPPGFGSGAETGLCWGWGGPSRPAEGRAGHAERQGRAGALARVRAACAGVAQLAAHTRARGHARAYARETRALGEACRTFGTCSAVGGLGLTRGRQRRPGLAPWGQVSRTGGSPSQGMTQMSAFSVTPVQGSARNHCAFRSGCFWHPCCSRCLA